MSTRSLLAAIAAVVVAAPALLRAQEPEADFVKARKEFIAGQPRATANTLISASLAVRAQVGRCRDDVIGTDLIDAENQIEKLVVALRAGTVTGVKTLDQTFTRIDRLLALHHTTAALTTIAHLRPDNIPSVARDLDRAAFHFERSITLDGGSPQPEQATAIAGARKMAQEIEATNAVPAGATPVLKTLEMQIRASSAVASR